MHLHCLMLLQSSVRAATGWARASCDAAVARRPALPRLQNPGPWPVHASALCLAWQVAVASLPLESVGRGEGERVVGCEVALLQARAWRDAPACLRGGSQLAYFPQPASSR